jgi:hypothetical protein
MTVKPKKSETFSESLRGFEFDEEEHEATSYILKLVRAKTKENSHP